MLSKINKKNATLIVLRLLKARKQDAETRQFVATCLFNLEQYCSTRFKIWLCQVTLKFYQNLFHLLCL